MRSDILAPLYEWIAVFGKELSMYFDIDVPMIKFVVCQGRNFGVNFFSYIQSRPGSRVEVQGTESWLQ